MLFRRPIHFRSGPKMRPIKFYIFGAEHRVFQGKIFSHSGGAAFLRSAEIT